MLRFTLALLMAVAAGCATKVTTFPNKEIARAQGALLIQNATNAAIVLVPPADDVAGTPEVTLQPGQDHRLEFTLSLQQNIGSSSREVLLVRDASSRLLTQSGIDLLVRAKFGSNSERGLRIKTGDCLFGESPPRREFPVTLRGPPLAGVPVESLCP